MPCERCKKKGIPIKCKYCDGSYCTRCMALEIHECPGLEKKIENDRIILTKKMEYTPPRKLELI